MKILLLGYGRMGRSIERVARERGHDIGHVHARTTAPDDAAWRGCDVAIEFSVPAAAERLCRRALSLGVPVVSGSTGWPVEPLRQSASARPGAPGFLHATNMSIGVNAVFAANELVARLLARMPATQAHIAETHHVHKLDRPSGTAITLAQGALAHLPQYTDWALTDGEPNIATALPIESIREGEVYGDHEVRYTTASDEVTLRHRARNRDGFALGAVLAAEWLPGRSGHFTMADVLRGD